MQLKRNSHEPTSGDGRLQLPLAVSGQGIRIWSVRLAAVAAVMLGLAAFAFWPHYLSKPSQADAYTHFHAVLGTCWLLLLIGQPLLIRRRKIVLHRAFGRLALVLASAFFATGLLTAHRGLVRMPVEELIREGYFVYMPLSLTVIFGVAVLLGVVWRTAPSIHGRFMACTALPLLDPLLARILSFYFSPLPAEFLYQVPALMLTIAAVLGMAVTIPKFARGRAAFWSFSLGTTVVLLTFFATPYSEMWLDFVMWFHALPIT